MRNQKTLFFTLIFLISSCASGNSPLENMLAGSSARVTALQEKVKDFHTALYWGSLEEAVINVEQTYKKEFIRKVRNFSSNHKFTNLELLSIEYNEDITEATIHVKVKYYKIPTYIVETSITEEIWKFDRFGGGWFLTSRVEIEDNK